MGERKYGVEAVDDITTRIDSALSGYETQHAGDRWYREPIAELSEIDAAIGTVVDVAATAVIGFVGQVAGAVASILDPDRAAEAEPAMEPGHERGLRHS